MHGVNAQLYRLTKRKMNLEQKLYSLKGLLDGVNSQLKLLQAYKKDQERDIKEMEKMRKLEAKRPAQTKRIIHYR